MKILIFANSDFGLYRFRKELIERLSHDHDVTIALPNGEFIDKLSALGCTYVPIEFNRRGMNPFSDLVLLGMYSRIVRKVKPDIVLTYTIKPNVYGGIACRMNKVSYIANVTGLGTSIENGGLLCRVTTTLYRIGLRRARCVFFQNKQNLALFQDKHIVIGKSRLIPGSGVNLETHNLEEYPSDSDGIRFLFVGRIMKNKGIDELLSATELVRNEYPNIHLDIVGGCDEGYNDRLRIAEEVENACYHGQQSEIHQFYKNAHCTILPSYHEGTSNVMLESAATGRPIITTRVPGCIETFEEGITGFGCDARDVESLADAMKSFLMLTQDEKRNMGLMGREKMIKEYDRSIVINAYIEEITAQKKTLKSGVN